jgi:hypothetical protein
LCHLLRLALEPRAAARLVLPARNRPELADEAVVLASVRPDRQTEHFRLQGQPVPTLRPKVIPKRLLRQGPLVLQLLRLAFVPLQLVLPHLSLALPPQTSQLELLSSPLRYQRIH